MKLHQVVASIATLALSASIAYAGGSTAFNYQGRLLDGGQPANGLFDFEFELWDAANGGNSIGLPQGFNNTPVTDGLFTLQIDFGANAFTNADRWLAVTVNTVLLSPRQPVTRVPYAISNARHLCRSRPRSIRRSRHADYTGRSIWHTPEHRRIRRNVRKYIFATGKAVLRLLCRR